MSEKKTMSADEARQFARTQFDNALTQLRQAASVYDQIMKQIAAGAALQTERWELEGHLHRCWDYYSQSGQDRFLHQKFFQGRENGCFVDVGAHDGVIGSNTLFFERTLGWRGLCIEASPTHYQELAANRRQLCLNLAIGDSPGTEKFLDIVTGYTQMGGFVSELRDLTVVRENPRHAEQEIEVEVVRLSDVLDQHGIQQIDYCSIDVEGAELRVLQGIDFERHEISVISAENAYHYHPTPNTEVRDYLTARGYRYVDTVGNDEIFSRS